MHISIWKPFKDALDKQKIVFKTRIYLIKYCFAFFIEASSVY